MYIVVKISQLCAMIEDSIQSGKYPLEDQQKRFANSIQVTNRSDSDDLKSSEIKIEVRIRGFYIIVLEWLSFIFIISVVPSGPVSGRREVARVAPLLSTAQHHFQTVGPCYRGEELGAENLDRSPS